MSERYTNHNITLWSDAFKSCVYFTLNDEMDSSKETVVASMDNVDYVATETAAAAEEVTASVEEVNATMHSLNECTIELDEIATSLKEAINKFKL